MGAKTGIILYASGDAGEILASRPQLDRAAAREFVERCFPGRVLGGIGDGTVGDDCYPAEGAAYVGCFPGLDVVCSRELMIERPSELPGRLIELGAGRRTYLHAMHSVVDWAAFAVWSDTTLVRSLSLWGGEGITCEDLGEPLPFEVPYWAGEHMLAGLWEDYPFPFHPLELGEAALGALFGFVLEGTGQPDDPDLDPDEIPLVGFQIAAVDDN
jgi:hypothetical protein